VSRRHTEIRPYSFDAQLSGGLVELRAELYRDDPSVTIGDTQRLLPRFDPSFAFYGRPDSRHRHFAALDGERVIGHVSAFVNGELTDRSGMPMGALGLFECVDDEAVARALLDAGLAWLREQERDALVLAPIDFDIWHGYRFRTRGFERSAFPGEPCNPPSYPAFFESHGFRPRERWESIEVDGVDVLRRLTEPCLARYRERQADGYRFEPMDAATDLRTLHALVMDSFAGFLGFTPLSFGEFEDIYGPLWHSIDLRLAGLVRDPGGAAVGFELAYPIGDRVIFYMIGVTRQELARRHGLGRAAFADIMGRIIDAGHERVVFALMSETSFARAGLRPVESQAQTEHTLYEWRAR